VNRRLIRGNILEQRELNLVTRHVLNAPQANAVAITQLKHLSSLGAQHSPNVMRSLAVHHRPITLKLLNEKSATHSNPRHKYVRAQHAAPHLGKISA
jgi:hypothetical protein